MREARLIGSIPPITPPRLLPCPWVVYRGCTDPSVNNFLLFFLYAQHRAKRARRDRPPRADGAQASAFYGLPLSKPRSARRRAAQACARLAAVERPECQQLFFQKALDNPARLCYYELGSAVSLARNFCSCDPQQLHGRPSLPDLARSASGCSCTQKVFAFSLGDSKHLFSYRGSAPPDGGGGGDLFGGFAEICKLAILYSIKRTE